ncbi:MAG: DUF2249 domain-containing protein [Burkholderiales bacterium]|nr:DUF2249 domain-containing protein [Burkholderiales bacterium]
MAQWQDADGWHVDVRGLTPPEPMVQVLQRVSQSPPDAVLIVHLDRDPVFLYPELAELGWQAETIDGDAGEVRLRVVRNAP